MHGIQEIDEMLVSHLVGIPLALPVPDQYELTRLHLSLVPPKYELAQPLPSRFVVVIVRIAIVPEPMPGLVLLASIHEVVPIFVFHLCTTIILCAFITAPPEPVEERHHFPGYGCRPWPPPLPLVHPPAQFPRPLLLLLGIRQRSAVRRGRKVSRLLLRTGPFGVETEQARPSWEYLGGRVGPSPVDRRFRFVRGGGAGVGVGRYCV